MICDRCKQEITMVGAASDKAFIEPDGDGFRVNFGDGTTSLTYTREIAEVILKNHMDQLKLASI